MSSARDGVRILIADDHALFRQGLKRLLQEERGFSVVGEAADCATTIKLVKQLKPDILLLDLAMPHQSGGEALRQSGLEALQELEASPSAVLMIVLTAGIDSSQIVQALQLGARGIVLKGSEFGILTAAIRSVMAGYYWIGQERVSDIPRRIRELGASSNRGPERDYGLTPRELQIVARILAGCPNKDIAQEFSLSERTVKHHLTNIFDKLGVSNRLELALFAVSHHLGEEPTPTLSPPAPKPSLVPQK